MFDKAENRLNSFLGSQCEFEGDLTVKGFLRIDGSIKGNVQADRLLLSESAYVEGELSAASIIVGGRIEGSLRASELVQIQSKGKVNGDVFTQKFLVTEGGEFNGRIEMNINGAGIQDPVADSIKA